MAFMFHPQNGREGFASANPSEALLQARVNMTPALRAVIDERLRELGGDYATLAAEFGFSE